MTTLHNMLSSSKVDITKVKTWIESDPDSIHAYHGNWSALDKAIQINRLDIVKLLVDNGANINAQDKAGVSALYLAIQEETTEIVRYLIESGADVHLRDEDGWSAIHYAIHREDQALIEIVLTQDIDLNVKTINPPYNLREFTKRHGAEVIPWFEGVLKAREEHWLLTQAAKPLEGELTESCASSSKPGMRL